MTPQSSSPRFRINEEVRLAGDRTKAGIIRRVMRFKNGNTDYLVYFSQGDEGWYPEDVISSIEDQGQSTQVVSQTAFLKDLTITKLESQLTDTLYSYLASRTYVEPYQFRPALKFLESPNQRLLLADEVGLGKTIEAGIIYLELKARLDLRRILVVCPSSLRNKWRDELLNRFDEDFVPMEARDFREFLDRFERHGGNRPLKAIVSLESIRREDILTRINEVELDLDLAIVDEAHHMRNPATLSHDVGSTLSGISSAMLLLTATPVQLRSADLFHLLHILDEGEFQNLLEFDSLLEPNLHINRATQMLSTNVDSVHRALNELRRVESTSQRDRFLNNPYYHYLCDQLSDPTEPEHRKLVEVRRGLQKLNTMSHVFNRTTKRDVDPGARRSANVVGVDLSLGEKEFYEGVLEYVKAQHQAASSRPGTPPSFAIIQRERQAASCIAAAREYIVNFATDSGVDIGAESNDTELDDVEITPVNKQDAAFQRLLAICNRLGDTDTKLRLFKETLEGIYGDTPNSKVIVFSFFKRTLNYLHRELRSSDSDFSNSVWLLHGDIPQAQRPRIVEDFRSAAGFGIMLMSEVGAEGLDFQFCDVLINYDLPWNPMRVEQRIGRIDRYGQTHERIRIFSFVINDTIEDRILQRLYARIGVFEESIGDLEPILGEEIAQLERALFSPQLSPREEAEKLEDILRSIEFKRLEADKFREEQKNLMGQDIIFSQQMEDVLSSGRFLSPTETRALVEECFRDGFTRTTLTKAKGDERIFVLRTSPSFRQYLNKHLRNNRYPSDLTGNLPRKLDNHLGMPVTFDGELALRRPLLEFLNLRHPIVAAAREYFQSKPRPSPMSRLGKLEVVGVDLPRGEYAFFIYLLRGIGVERSTTLAPVVLDCGGRYNEIVESKLLAGLPVAQEAPGRLVAWDWPKLEEISYRRFAKIRDETQRELSIRNTALIYGRKAALTQTYNFKIRRASEQAQKATEPRIRRMREAQAQRLKGELEDKLAELEGRRHVAVGGELVSAGYIQVA